MRTIFSLLLLLGGTTLVACKSNESAYEVEDPTEVTLDVSGMT